MTDASKLLEKTISRLRELTSEQIELVDAYLDELNEDKEPYVLSDEELATLEPELKGALAGDFASEEEVERSFLRPWK